MTDEKFLAILRTRVQNLEDAVAKAQAALEFERGVLARFESAIASRSAYSRSEGQ